MRRLALAALPALLVAGPGVPSTTVKPAFPFKIHQRTLPNGLRVAVIPTGMPNLVSLQIPVSTGSRNEVEPGKSGFAHFFEHMMFRGTPTVNKDQWNAQLQRSGASQNAFTSDDLTNYHTLFAKEDLETWLRLEADRFQHLSYSEGDFKTESRAVLGEYNKNAANPMRKLFEVQRDAAFTTHTYKHTTMGFLKDIEDMPNQYAYSKQFFQRWYKPENVTVIVAGDVDPARTFALVEKYFGGWQRGSAKPPVIPQEPETKAPVTAHVAWETPTLPWLTVAFHTPAHFSTRDKASSALDFAAQELFGSRSELYQRLVVKEQKVDQLFTDGGDSKDPSLFTVGARLKRVEDMAYVRDLVLETCAKGRALPFSATKLEEAKTEARLAFQRSLDSTTAAASLVARFASYERDPEAVNKALALQETVTVSDLAAIAKATFRDNGRVITTLCHEALPENLKGDVQGVEVRAAQLAVLPNLPLLEEANPASPLINVRASFRVGSLHDPKGKEGLAVLTAAMLSEAATKTRSLPELTKAYGATGARLSGLVDKERTTFTLSGPKLKGTEALELMLDQMTQTGFKAEDFQRLKTRQLNALKVGLKANNDEELGKVALEARMYAGPLATPILGTESGLQAITLEDVQAFAKTYYTRQRLTLGLGGGFSPEQKAALLRGMGSLPETDAPKVMVSEAEHLDRTHLQIITKDSRATAISFGIPLRERNEAGAGAKGHRRTKGDDPKGEAQDGPSDKGELLDARVNRAHPDFPALWIATSHLGQHRDSTGVLYQRLREIRGLNYGDYAYLEAFPNGSAQFQPSPGVARTFNHWQVWIRPVPPASAAFAIKGALYEMDKLIKQGLSESEFRAAQTFLVKFMDHLTDTGAKRLGHDMDNAEFGLGAYADTMKERLGKVTREDVNRVIRKYLRTTALDMVVIAKDAEAFKQDLLSEASTIPVYTAPKPELRAEDEAIRRFKLDLDPKDITVTPVNELFK